MSSRTVTKVIAASTIVGLAAWAAACATLGDGEGERAGGAVYLVKVTGTKG
jgi:hypothetical protein